MYHLERKMYQNVTGVIFSMPGGKEYIKDKQWNELDFNKFYYVNNGVKLDEFYQQIENNTLVDEDLEDDSFKVVYAGSVRIANNIMALVQAAEKLKDNTKMFSHRNMTNF